MLSSATEAKRRPKIFSKSHGPATPADRQEIQQAEDTLSMSMQTLDILKSTQPEGPVELVHAVVNGETYDRVSAQPGHFVASKAETRIEYRESADHRFQTCQVSYPAEPGTFHNWRVLSTPKVFVIENA